MSGFLFNMCRDNKTHITFPYALVVLIHHYTGGRKSMNLRDYDNLEKSCVLNALQTTGLFADSPAHMMLVELAAADTRNFTEVLITSISNLKKVVAELDLRMYDGGGIDPEKSGREELN
jgi:hypothetical protein